MELKNLSRQELINNTSRLVEKEREITAELIRLLCEIERRRLHLEMGYGSMFELLTKHYAYSEGSADRRISAMRLSKDVPSVVEAIEAGRLTLSTASQVQHFFRNEQKLGKKYTPEQKSELTHKFEGKSRRECERELLKLSPESVLPKERERQVTPTETEIRFVADAELMSKLERLKALMAHHGNLGYAELFEQLADHALKKLDPEKKRPEPKQPEPPVPTPPAGPGNPPANITTPRKAIRAEDRHAVYQRSGGCCEYVDPISGRRCNSKWAVQIDHITPLAKGGTHELGNYRLACRSHNQFFAIQEFGLPFMEQYLNRSKARGRYK
jgi:hypothetical protein